MESHNKLLENYDKEILSLKRKIEKAPDGKIVVSHNGKYFKFYKSDGKNYEYIPAESVELAEKLALKKQCILKLRMLENRRKMLTAIINADTVATKAYYKFIADPAIIKLLNLDNANIGNASEWMHATYETNPYHREKLIYKCGNGLAVRSKSETIIVLCLLERKIDFRYECLLELNGEKRYPDFTILHPVTGKKVYLEHLGMLDNREYYEENAKKIRFYIKNGLIPFRDIFFTYETSDAPLTYDAVEKMLDLYFCN